MNKSGNNWWADLVRTQCTGCQQDIPSILAELSTVMQECPFTQPEARSEIRDLLAGCLKHGAYAAWAAVATATPPWRPWGIRNKQVSWSARFLYSLALNITLERLKSGAIPPPEEAAWSAVFGKLPPTEPLLKLSDLPKRAQ